MRQDIAGDRPVKARRRNKAVRKPRIAAKAADRRPASQPRPKTDVARLSRELHELVDQQQATAEVLRLISGSSGDLQPVFSNILASAVRLCDAHNGVINRWDGHALQLTATLNMPPAFVELRKQSRYNRHQHSASGRMLATRKPVHIADLAGDRAYLEGNPPTVAAVELGGVRTMLAVPMLKENELIGSFSIGRTEMRPFTDKQIEIVQSFAAQAVVAVENARLLHELRETLQQQTATAKVLQVIAGSPGDLKPVFETVLENASQLCDAEFGNIYRWDGEALYLVAWHNTPAAFAEYRKSGPFHPSATSLVGRMVKTKAAIHVADARDNPDYIDRRDPSLVAAIELGGVRTYLAIPMLKEANLVGAITVFRQEVRPFNDKQIALMTNFANQVSIAIENMRLLTELRHRTETLGRTVAELQRERANKLMSLEAMTASISHEVRQPLASIASNGGAALRFLAHTPPDLEEVSAALNRMVSDSHRAGGIFDNIRALFGKAGRGRELFDLNELIHAMLEDLRGELNDRKISAGIELLPDLPLINGHRGQLQEVLINLVRNAIEAMDAVEDDSRTLKVATVLQGAKKIVLTVEDSGPGIDAKQAANIFDPFVTTKSHGMGLGLALCRMIVERHAGQLSTSPAHPRGSIFRVVLPVAGVNRRA
jgi:signal transduction histidine kinase/putative component of toxin-antitoxin plasmid stabilization module